MHVGNSFSQNLDTNFRQQHESCPFKVPRVVYLFARQVPGLLLWIECYRHCFPCLSGSRCAPNPIVIFRIYAAYDAFNVMDTHLTDIYGLIKFVALVLVTFVWAYKAGIYLQLPVPFKIEDMAERQKQSQTQSNCSTNLLFFNSFERFCECCKFLACT